MSQIINSSILRDASAAMSPHPFYPLELEMVDYVANKWGAFTLLSIFLSGWVVILGAVWAGASKYYPALRIGDKWALLWFVLTATIHFFFEGYFAFNHFRMQGAQDLFGQLWKEYSLSDSRYLTSDPFVLCMETTTAIAWGPLSYVVAYFITIQHPLRFPLQAVVSLGQIYGLVLYYATALFDHYYKNLAYCRPEAYYFWFYFFFMNFIWMVIPGWLLYQSIRNSAIAFAAYDKMNKSSSSNGTAKKAGADGKKNA